MTKKMLLLPILIVGLFNSASVFCGATAEEKILASLEKRTAPQKARVIIASLPVNATVADLFVSKKRGHVGFNVPTLPMSVSRNFLLPAPIKMKSYKLFHKLSCGAEITAAGFWRFITNAHVLFYNKEKRRLIGDGLEYLDSVKDAIDAHKEWFVSQTEDTRLELNKKEDAVMKLLAKLPLSDHRTRFLVEQMLSTCVSDHKRFLRRATMSNSLKRTNANAHPKGFIRTCAENLGVNAGVALAAGVSVLGAAACYYAKGGRRVSGVASQSSVPTSTMTFLAGFPKPSKCQQIAGAGVTAAVFAYLWMKDIYDWKTDYNLIPEPVDGGIKVVIKLDPFLS